MALVNEHFLKLPGSYLFSDIAKKVNSFKITHPKQDVIRLGIGDVTRPLPPACIEAMHKAVDEMADAKTFRGYGPEQGYDFLIDPEERFRPARRPPLARRNLHQRRRQERHGKHRRTAALGQ